ncbi:hypothetical protein TNCV_1544111 [Trichonephila clavipes]|nr:hypothetical protein TNCV_1544111 [Trichonephila clavipes]
MFRIILIDEHTHLYISLRRPWVAWWLEQQISDRKPWVRCPMPPNTLRVHTENVLVKSVGPKVLWADHECRGVENISLPSSPMAKLWRWRKVVSPSIVLSGNFAKLIRTVTCMVLKV